MTLNIDNIIKNEYNSDFAKSVERICVAQVMLVVEEDKETYYQPALIGLMKHKTDFCRRNAQANCRFDPSYHCRARGGCRGRVDGGLRFGV